MYVCMPVNRRPLNGDSSRPEERRPIWNNIGYIVFHALIIFVFYNFALHTLQIAAIRCHYSDTFRPWKSGLLLGAVPHRMEISIGIATPRTTSQQEALKLSTSVEYEIIIRVVVSANILL